MSHDSDKHVLLSAYLRGDLSPEERAAVETQLQQDPSFRALAQEMTELIALLKGAERPVPQQMVATLRQRLAKSVSEHSEVLSTGALISASISNDLNEREAALLQQILKKSPDRAREHEALKAVSAMLAKGERPVSDALSQQLYARLKAKLPDAALHPASLQPVPQAGVRATLPSLRVYAVPAANPWRNRVLWAAASVALVFGLSAALQSWNRPQPENVAGDPLLGKDSDVNPILPDVAIKPAPPVAPEPENRFVEAPRRPAPAPVVDNTPKTRAPLLPPVPEQQPDAPKIVERLPVPAPVPAPNREPTLVEVEVEVEKRAKSNPDKDPTHSAPKPAPDVVQLPDPQNDSVIVQNDPKRTTGAPIVGNGGVVTPPSTDLALADPTRKIATSEVPDVNPNDSITPAEGQAVVGAVLSNVLGTSDNKQTQLKLRDVLPSDTEVVTGEGLTALLLPDGSRLYANRASNLKFTLKGKRDVTVALRSGEITYKGTGSLTVNSANISVHNGKEVNVKIQDNRLTVSVMDGSSKLENKTVGKSAQASIALAGDATVTYGAALTAAPDWSWRSQLIFPGENSNNGSKTITNEKQPDSGNRGVRPSKSTRRR